MSACVVFAQVDDFLARFPHAARVHFTKGMLFVEQARSAQLVGGGGGAGGGGGGSGSGSGDGGSGGLASTASRIMAMTTLMRTTRAGREKTARFLESQAVSHFQQATWLDAQMWDAHWQLGRLLVSE